jgi:hypothetical protein
VQARAGLADGAAATGVDEGHGSEEASPSAPPAEDGGVDSLVPVDGGSDLESGGEEDRDGDEMADVAGGGDAEGESPAADGGTPEDSAFDAEVREVGADGSDRLEGGDHDAAGADTGMDATPADDGPEADAEADAEPADSPAPADGGDGSVDDGGPRNATEAMLLAARGLSCLTCARQSGCLDPGDTCGDLAGQLVAAGSDAGGSRETMCLDTLSCVLDTFCNEEASSVDGCICGQQGRAECRTNGPLSDPAGDCIAQEQAGLETSDVNAELTAEGDKTLGAGMANALFICLERAPCDDCL